MSLIYLAPINDQDLLASEDSQLLQLQTPPSSGDRVSLGSARLWTVVAVDEYRPNHGNQTPLYLVHCHRGEVPPRPEWFLVQACQRQPIALRLYLGDGELLHWGVDLKGEEPATGVLLPQYNVESHTVTDRPWGVEAVTLYKPAPSVDLPCYCSVWVGQCVSVPEVLDRSTTASLQAV